MTKARFIGDDWTCQCGNQTHTDGFYPCLKSGQFVKPIKQDWTDGYLYRCRRCDSIIEYDENEDVGRIVGMTEPAFLDQEEVEW